LKIIFEPKNLKPIVSSSAGQTTTSFSFLIGGVRREKGRLKFSGICLVLPLLPQLEAMHHGQ